MTSIDYLRKHREALFWTLHVAGWGAFAIAHYLGALVYWKPASYTKVILIAALAGIVVSLPLRYICRWLWCRPLFTVIGVALVAAYTTSLAWRFLVNLAYAHYMPEMLEGQPMRISSMVDGVVSGTYIMVCWMGLYFAFHYYESMQQQREAALRAATLAQEAQVKMLRYQLNPHFLFNTLNAISTLILDQQNKVANAAVTRLSDFLRYTLDQDPMKKVTVAQELEALNLYLDIEKMRFGSRLTIEYAVEEQASRALIPSLLLQPLIENAIKYAVSPREEGGRIRISAQVSSGTLVLMVSDDGPGISDAVRISNGRGVGIRNTRERLNVLYGAEAGVRVENTSPGLRVSLSLPAELVKAAA